MTAGKKSILAYDANAMRNAGVSIYLPDSQKFAIPRISRDWFEPGISAELTNEFAYVLRMRILAYSDYARLFAEVA
jgi:hypothetical protein